MHGDEIFVADYLIQFDVMDMSGRAALGSVHDQQLLMRVDPHPWHPVSLHAVPDGERMAFEDIGQEPHGFVTALWNVHPDQRVVLLQQCFDVGHIVRLDLVARKRQHPHPGHVPTLDPKEPHGTLPLSERPMKNGPQRRHEHAPSSILSCISPDRPTASAVKAESSFRQCICNRERYMVGVAAESRCRRFLAYPPPTPRTTRTDTCRSPAEAC